MYQTLLSLGYDLRSHYSDKKCFRQINFIIIIVLITNTETVSQRRKYQCDDITHKALITAYVLLHRIYANVFS